MAQESAPMRTSLYTLMHRLNNGSNNKKLKDADNVKT